MKCYENPCGWYDQLPWVLVALRNSPKQDLDYATPCEITFGETLRLPGEFFEEHAHSSSDLPDQAFVHNLHRFVQSLRYQPPRTANRPSHLERELFGPETTHCYVRINSYKPLLHPSYRGPYRILEKHPKYFVVDFLSHRDKVSIDRIKCAHLSFSSLNEACTSNDTAISTYHSSPQTPTPHSPLSNTTLTTTSQLHTPSPQLTPCTTHTPTVRLPAR